MRLGCGRESETVEPGLEPGAVEVARDVRVELGRAERADQRALVRVQGFELRPDAFVPTQRPLLVVALGGEELRSGDDAGPERLAQLCAAALEDEIAFQGANTIAAMIMEPILGAGGVIVPHESFAPMVRDICDRNGILLITDEVITAYGRTGAWSGARLWGIRPDMMATAKAITNGYFPFGAVMLGDRMVQTFEDNPAAKIGHGYTYSGHPVGAAAALACLAETKRLNVIENAAARGTQLYEGCLELQSRYDIIGDVRGGHGLMTAIEMVSDRATKTPIDAATATKVQEVAYQGVGGRLAGSLATMLIALDQGAQIVRVHDVAETAQAIALWRGART